MKMRLAVPAVLVAGALSSSCGDDPERLRIGALAAQESGFPEWALGLYGPALQAPAVKNPALVALGRALYYETALSENRKVSCNSCHPLAAWGTTTRPVPANHGARTSRLDIPTVYNAAVEVDLFWDGRAHDVETQARESIKSPLEMAMPDEAVPVARLRAMPRYRAAFRAAFPSEVEPVTFANLARALGAFERGLVTPSRWDQFLAGKGSALSPQEKRGFERFVHMGCSDCHNGVAVGGRMFQVAGEVRPWPLQSDSGRYATTRKAEDLFVFRVPQLRNIAMTGPYFDTGVVTDLAEAVRLMARYQRGMNLTEADVVDIVAWLRTLTGEVPREYIAPQAVIASR